MPRGGSASAAGAEERHSCVVQQKSSQYTLKPAAARKLIYAAEHAVLIDNFVGYVYQDPGFTFSPVLMDATNESDIRTDLCGCAG